MFQLVFAWFAAAAFVASLGFFLYAYFVLFGEPAPSGVQPAPSSLETAPSFGPFLFNVLLFSVFALHHSLFARTRIKQLVRDRIPPALERALYTLVASVLFVLVCLFWQPVPGQAWRLDAAWRWMAYGVQAAGVGIILLAARALDALELAGVRQVQRRPAASAPLETDGMYGLVRHPLYFGWVLLVFGAPDMTYTRLVFACVSTLYLVIAIPFEERSLIETFGPDYASYQRKVRWRILPWIY